MVLTYRTQIETHRHVGLPVACRVSLAGSGNERQEWDGSFRVERPTGGKDAAPALEEKRR